MAPSLCDLPKCALTLRQVLAVWAKVGAAQMAAAWHTVFLLSARLPPSHVAAINPSKSRRIVAFYNPCALHALHCDQSSALLALDSARRRR